MSGTVDNCVLVIYDVSDVKRRRKINKVLKGFGVRIQRSAFECMIDDFQFERLVYKMSKIIDITTDVMKIYRFTSNVVTKSFGEFAEPSDEDFSVI